jgi:ADP-heptose:LPS heptosyltransferase
MGGSALNWPENHYAELIRSLLLEGHRVLLTGGPTESELIRRLHAALGDQASGVVQFLGDARQNVDFLGALFSQMSLVVAPSTGPLHLAVALKVPVLTFYPPIRVQSVLRWGPYLPTATGEKQAAILVPEVYCGQDFKCRGTSCNFYPCMKGLTVAQALEEARGLLNRGTAHG